MATLLILLHVVDLENKLCVSHLQPKTTKVSTECVNDSRKQRLVGDQAYIVQVLATTVHNKTNTIAVMWLLLQNVIAFLPYAQVIPEEKVGYGSDAKRGQNLEAEAKNNYKKKQQIMINNI